MSKFFYGYVEVMSNGQWDLVFTTDAFFAGSNNDAMERLFGVPGKSLVGERGIPTDASPAIREYYG